MKEKEELEIEGQEYGVVGGGLGGQQDLQWFGGSREGRDGLRGSVILEEDDSEESSF